MKKNIYQPFWTYIFISSVHSNDLYNQLAVSSVAHLMLHSIAFIKSNLLRLYPHPNKILSVKNCQLWCVVAVGFHKSFILFKMVFQCFYTKAFINHQHPGQRFNASTFQGRNFAQQLDLETIYSLFFGDWYWLDWWLILLWFRFLFWRRKDTST